MCTLVSPWKAQVQLTVSLFSTSAPIKLSFAFVYFSSEDDHTGVRVVERDECGGGHVYLMAGDGSRGQGVCRVQVESSLTATAGKGQEGGSVGGQLSMSTDAL